MAKGFLLVTMDPPPGLEDEFNDWYDMEHIPDRASIAGFETARRYVCVSGWPKYLAFYDLEEIGVLERPSYKQASWGNFSPWTKRTVAKVRGQYRGSGDQIYPGNALTGELARLILIRFHDVPDAEGPAIVSALRASYEGRKEVRQLRVLRSNYDNQIDYLAMVEARVPLLDPRPDLDALGASADRIDLFNEYMPYWTRGRLAGVFPAK
ncbi:MAG: hypothetical protein IT531_03745 [Burkholderiales bacterium]|nr:hypothetical protein [Burkholderiales bacterium]